MTATRPTMHRRQFLGLLGTASLGLLAACTSAPASAPAQSAAQPTAAAPAAPTQVAAGKASAAATSGGTLTIGQDVEPVGLDPHLSPAWASQNVFEHVYEPLLRFDADGKLQPGLAVKWEQPDSRTYIFELRQGVKFHNGRDFTAEDVAYNFARQADPKLGGVNKNVYEVVEKSEVLDPHKIKVTLKDVSAPFINVLGSPLQGSIVPQEGGDLKTHPIGTGPFKFVEAVSGSHVKLEKNAQYWDTGKPLLDSIVFKIIKDEQSRVDATRTGEVDMTWVANPVVAKAVQGDATVRVIGGNFNKPVPLYINNTVKQFGDKRVRQAVSLALNRQEMFQTNVLGFGTLSTAVPPVDKFWVLPDTDKLPYYQQDVQRAKQLLADAGYAGGFKVTIHVPAPFPLHIADGELTQGYLKAIGVDAVLARTEWGQHLDDLKNRKYELLVTGGKPFADPDSYFYPDMHSKSPNNQTGYANPELDKLLDKGRATLDPAERQKIYWDAQRLIAEEVPMIWLYSEPVRIEIVKARVQGGYRGIDKFLSRYPQLNEVRIEA